MYFVCLIANDGLSFFYFVCLLIERLMNKHMSGIAAIIATIIFSFISSFRKRSPPRGITKKLSYINKQIDFYENLFKISQDSNEKR